MSTLIGPHCHHDECSWHVCDHTGYVEFPCRRETCELCGAPPVETPEHWAGATGRFDGMSPAEQARVRAYWARYPRVRRPGDPQVITDERQNAALSQEGTHR